MKNQKEVFDTLCEAVYVLRQLRRYKSELPLLVSEKTYISDSTKKFDSILERLENTGIEKTFSKGIQNERDA